MSAVVFWIGDFCPITQNAIENQGRKHNILCNWKSCVRLITDRGFESLPLRHKKSCRNTRLLLFCMYKSKGRPLHIFSVILVHIPQIRVKTRINAGDSLLRSFLFWQEIVCSLVYRFLPAWQSVIIYAQCCTYVRMSKRH